MNENVMNDQYGMEDLLEQEKYLIHNYGTFIPEASEMPLRTVLTDNLNGCVKDQYQVFAKMEQMGWFKGQEADVNVLTGAKQRFSRMQNVSPSITGIITSDTTMSGTLSTASFSPLCPSAASIT